MLSAALAAILMVLAGTAPAAPTGSAQNSPLRGVGNWLTTVDTTGGGHAIGNPQAKVKLTEFVSYTCPHCGHFAQEAANAVDLYVASGKVQLDVHHVIRDPVDLTAAMIANCGPAIKFPRNHAVLFAAQPRWLPIMARSTPAQQARWTSGPGGQRRRAIASDMGFYDLMEGRGYDRVAIDRCLNDEALAKRLADQSAADEKKWDVHSTPSFAIDNTVLAGTWTWDVLRPQLDARL